MLAKRMSMELSMLLAVVAAAAIARWITALVIVAFALAAEFLRTYRWSAGEILCKLLPASSTHVTIKQDPGAIRVPIKKLQLGDVVIVKTGEHLAVDGVVTAGSAALDQSHLTGEPLPVDVTIGFTVFSESIVSDGGIEVRSTRLAEDSSYGRIIAAATNHLHRDSGPGIPDFGDLGSGRVRCSGRNPTGIDCFYRECSASWQLR